MATLGVQYIISVLKKLNCNCNKHMLEKHDREMHSAKMLKIIHEPAVGLTSRVPL